MKTNRREFVKSIVGDGAKLYLALAGLPLISACGSKEETLNVNGNVYQIQGGVLDQKNTRRPKIKIGVMSDLHANKENSQYFADQLDKEGAEVYLLTGDLSHSFGDYDGAKDDFNEILDVVEPVAVKGKLVLVMPGNHEQKRTYKKALKKLASKYPNVVDMEETPVADLNGLTIVGLGGNANRRFCVPDGYLRNTSDFGEIKELAQEYRSGPKPLLIATHIPKRYSTERGLDVISKWGKHVGGTALGNVRNLIDSRFAVSGHIHEAPGIITPDEQPIKEGELSDKLDFNPGAVYDHTGQGLRPAAGMLEFIEDKARAYILKK